jgi:hypothetical protein
MPKYYLPLDLIKPLAHDLPPPVSLSLPHSLRISRAHLHPVECLPHNFESLHLLVLDNQLVAASPFLQGMQPPRQQIRREELHSAELQSQILLLPVVFPLKD